MRYSKDSKRYSTAATADISYLWYCIHISMLQYTTNVHSLLFGRIILQIASTGRTTVYRRAEASRKQLEVWISWLSVTFLLQCPRWAAWSRLLPVSLRQSTPSNLGYKLTECCKYKLKESSNVLNTIYDDISWSVGCNRWLCLVSGSAPYCFAAWSLPPCLPTWSCLFILSRPPGGARWLTNFRLGLDWTQRNIWHLYRPIKSTYMSS